MCPATTTPLPRPVAAEYDPVRQLRIDGKGQPVMEMGPPTAPTTGSQDGSDGDPSEDYVND
jgi:putative ATP-grasp target RiPP